MIHTFSVTMPEYKDNSRIFVELPFNVWELFNRKGAMRVKGSVNDLAYECALIPRGNGVYLFPINKKIIKESKISIGDNLSITMELISDDKNVDKKNDVNKACQYRKIKSVNYIKEPNSKACGQACIAMLAGVDVDEVIKIMNAKGSTSIGQMIEALDHYGIRHAGRNKRISKKNPHFSDASLLTVHMPGYSHWVLYFRGRFYDPEFGELEECHSDGKVTSYLEIYLE